MTRRVGRDSIGAERFHHPAVVVDRTGSAKAATAASRTLPFTTKSVRYSESAMRASSPSSACSDCLGTQPRPLFVDHQRALYSDSDRHSDRLMTQEQPSNTGNPGPSENLKKSLRGPKTVNRSHLDPTGEARFH